jgi:ribonuclease Z
MSIKLTILGCHSANPGANENHTSQYLEIKNHHFLVDCGEGTQNQLKKLKLSPAKINRIFISHLHGDHFFGLIGLIASYSLLNREQELHVHGPRGIKEIIMVQLTLMNNSRTKYPLIFHELDTKESVLIFEDEKVSVHTIPLDHSIYVNGFLFKEKLGKRKLNINVVNSYEEISICDYQNLKNGQDFISEDGTVIKNSELTLDPPPPLSYAYCSDTSYKESIVPIIKEVSCLYHEATFLHELKELATTTNHSTALEAAKIATLANAKQLILGHYSNRYRDKEVFKEEAKQLFENVFIAKEGKFFEIG